MAMIYIISSYEKLIEWVLGGFSIPELTGQKKPNTFVSGLLVAGTGLEPVTFGL